MSFTKSERASCVSFGKGSVARHAYGARNDRQGSAAVSQWVNLSGGQRPNSAGSSQGILNILMAVKKTAAAASHIVSREHTISTRDKKIAEKAAHAATESILKRNRKLPRDLVFRLALAEFMGA